jgi:hypothetical protein
MAHGEAYYHQLRLKTSAPTVTKKTLVLTQPFFIFFEEKNRFTDDKKKFAVVARH